MTNKNDERRDKGERREILRKEVNRRIISEGKCGIEKVKVKEDKEKKK